MLSKSKLLLIFSVVIALIPFLVYYVLFPHMPEQVPVHYDISGTADRFVARTSWELLFLSALGLIGLFVMILLYIFFHKRQLPSYKKDIPTALAIWRTATLGVTILFAAIGVAALMMMV